MSGRFIAIKTIIFGVGTMQGLCRYDYATNKFIRYASPSFTIITIREDKKGTIWLGTNDGLWIVDKQKTAIKKFTLNNNPGFLKKFQCAVQEFTDLLMAIGTWLHRVA
jgi:ligand-binding sensor domain-containing protein